VLYTFSNFFANDEFLRKSKWINNLLSEIVPLIVFGVLVFFLQSSIVKEEEISVHELESDSNFHNFNSSRMSTNTRRIEIK
jgi:hypothetical protein